MILLRHHKEDILVHSLVANSLILPQLLEKPSADIQNANIVSQHRQRHDAAGKRIRKGTNLLHVCPNVLAGHSHIDNGKAFSLSPKSQRHAQVDAGFLMLGDQIHIEYRNGDRVQSGRRMNGSNIHRICLRILLQGLPQELADGTDILQMPNLIGSNPDDVIRQKGTYSVCILFCKILCQKILSEIKRTLHIQNLNS